MSIPQEAEQHLVLFVGAGDGSDAACEAVARKLSEKFGAPFEKMLTSVRQSPRVFKRNLSLAQAESCAALLRSLGAVAEVQPGGTDTVEPPPAPAPEPRKPPPPPVVTEHNCPFCGRTLQNGVCIICQPRVLIGAENAVPAIEPDQTTENPEFETDAGIHEEPPPEEALTEAEPAEPEFMSAAFDAGAASLEVGDYAGPAVEPGCAGCGGTLDQDGQCPACDGGMWTAPEEMAPPATDQSATIENDLSAMLSPEELGVCPNCCGPMEQDGNCLICPPAEQPEGAAATGEASSPPAAPLGTLGELSLEDPPPSPEPAESAPADEPSPFEPLAPLNADPEVAGDGVCLSCGGPKGADGICLICGEEADREESNAPGLPDAAGLEEMTVTGNEPPPARPREPEAAAEAPEDPPEEDEFFSAPETDPPDHATGPATVEPKGPGTAGVKQQGGERNRPGMPRALTIPLLFTLLLLIGGIALAMAGSFVIACGVYFLALLAGLVSMFNGTRHLEQTVSGFPRLPKPVIFAFLVFLFIAGSGGIATYAVKQSAMLLMEKAGEHLMTETEQLAGETGRLAGTAADDAQGLEPVDGGGQILMEEEMLEQAIEAEREGDNDPRAALQGWTAYLEEFPDGSRAAEARRKISQWKAVVQQEDALGAAIARDRKGNADPTSRIRDWQGIIATYGNTPAIRSHAEERINFWKSMLTQRTAPRLPYWASLRLDDGRTFSGKVIAEGDRELKMELPNRLKMSFSKGEFELVDSDHINGKRVEGEDMGLVSGVTTDRPRWGAEDGCTILGEERAGIETTVSFQLTGFYHFEVMARADRDHGGFPSVILSLNGAQQERIRFDSEDWKLYQVTFPFRIPAGEHRLEIVFPPQYQTMKDKRLVAIDYFTTAMVE